MSIKEPTSAARMSCQNLTCQTRISIACRTNLRRRTVKPFMRRLCTSDYCSYLLTAHSTNTFDRLTTETTCSQRSSLQRKRNLPRPVSVARPPRDSPKAPKRHHQGKMKPCSKVVLDNRSTLTLTLRATAQYVTHRRLSPSRSKPRFFTR